MNQSSAIKTLRTLFAYALVLVLVIMAMVLQSCKPTASPSTLSSPLLLPNAPTLTEVAIRQMLISKATMSAQIDQTEVAARLIPRTKVFGPTYLPITPQVISTAYPPLTGSDLTPAGAGVITQRMPPLNPGRYHITNEWIEDRNNGRQRIFVNIGELAGPDGGSTGQGVIVVQVWQISITNNIATSNLIEQTEYLTPNQVGPVKIADAVGERLVLQSTTTGTTLYFDVPSRQYVASLTAVVPASLLSPLATPVP